MENLRHEPSSPPRVKRVKRERKNKPSSQLSPGGLQTPKPRQRKCQKPDMRRVENLSEVFQITKPNHLNQPESLKTSKSLFGAESNCSGQTYPAEYRSDIPFSSLQHGSVEDLPAPHVSNTNFQDSLEKLRDDCNHTQFPHETIILSMEQLNEFDLIDSSPQRAEGPSSSDIHRDISHDDCLDKKPCSHLNQEKNLFIHQEVVDSNLDYMDNLNMFDDEELLLDEGDDFSSCINDASSSVDESFPWNDADLEEMIQLTEASQQATPLGYNKDVDGDTHNPWNIDEDDDIDMLCSTHSFDSPNQKPLEDGNDSYEVTMDEGDVVSSPPHLSSGSSYCNIHSVSPNKNAETSEKNCHDQAEDMYEDHDLENELSKLMTSPDSAMQNPLPSVSMTTPIIRSQSASHITENLSPQATSSETTANVPHLISFNAEGNPIPFIRPPFAKPIRDRSPILGLNTRMILRICFRIGEALNAATIASRTNVDTIVELYAYVAVSEREMGSFRQTFTFADIFMYDKPPFLHGTYTLWRGAELWDHDSGVFLGENGNGKMARIIGRVNRNEEKKTWTMSIMNIWQVDWEDIGIAKGIVCP